LASIYKIVTAQAWAAAVETGRFDGAAIDLTDGFIHFSTREQVQETAAKHFAGQDGLLLVGVAAQDLGDALVYEASRGGQMFPHLYGSLPTAFALFALPLPLRPDGAHDFAGLLP
jgi:uncharacterized protein (DUF952 family)